MAETAQTTAAAYPALPLSLTSALPEGTHPKLHKTPPHPIRRFIARILDLGLLLYVGALVFLPIGYGLIRADVLSATLNSPPIWFMFLNAIIIAVLQLLFVPLFTTWLGTTPGKWVMGIWVRKEGDENPNLKQSFIREFGALGLGNAFNLPYICPVFNLYFYFYLNRCGTTPWDLSANTLILYKQRNVFLTMLLILLITIVPMLITVFVVGVTTPLFVDLSAKFAGGLAR